MLKSYCVFRAKVDFLLETLLLPQSSHEPRGKKSTQKIIVLYGWGISNQTSRPQEKWKLIASDLSCCIYVLSNNTCKFNGLVRKLFSSFNPDIVLMLLSFIISMWLKCLLSGILKILFVLKDM